MMSAVERFHRNVVYGSREKNLYVQAKQRYTVISIYYQKLTLQPREAVFVKKVFETQILKIIKRLIIELELETRC